MPVCAHTGTANGAVRAGLPVRALRTLRMVPSRKALSPWLTPLALCHGPSRSDGFSKE